MLLSAGGQAAAQDMCLLVPWHLLGQLPNEHLIFLSASPNAGSHTVEGSGVQGKEDGGESERKWRGRQRKET
jgi:hypothetical protein